MAPDQALPGLAPIDPRLLNGFALPLLQQLVALAGKGGARLPLLALNGPVGAGKTNLGRVLEALAPSLGLRLVVASIDDLYLPWPQRQQRLAGNPFGVSRVPPGSHDLQLLLEALSDWRQSGVLRLPRFDKTLAQGQGDRLGWRQGPCDALVLEGWLMGCRALGPESLGKALEVFDLERPAAGGAPALTTRERDWLAFWDRQLQAYGPLWDACDGLWLLRPLNWQLPRRWRFQAEARQRHAGGGWLQPAALDQLVRSSLCSLPPSLYQDPLVVDPLMVLEPEIGPTTTTTARELGSLVAEALNPQGLSMVALAANAWLAESSSPMAGTGAQDGPQACGGAAAGPADATGVQAVRGAPESWATMRRAASRLGSIKACDERPEVVAAGAAAAGGLMPEGQATQRLPLQGLALLDSRRRCQGLWRRQNQDSGFAF